MFEWDEEKRHLVLAKHGLDFIDVVAVFEGDHVEVAARSETELREAITGRVGDDIVTVIFTRRDHRIRLITARRARRNERRAYHARYP